MQSVSVGIRKGGFQSQFPLFLSPKAASAVCKYGDGAAFDDSASFSRALRTNDKIIEEVAEIFDFDGFFFV